MSEEKKVKLLAKHDSVVELAKISLNTTIHVRLVGPEGTDALLEKAKKTVRDMEVKE